MNEAVVPDWKHNPVLRPAFEAGVREQRRRYAPLLMNIAQAMHREHSQALVGSVPDGRLEELIRALTNMLTARIEEARQQLDQVISTMRP